MSATISRWLFATAAMSTAASALASGPYYTVTSTGSDGNCTLDSTSDSDCTLDAAITAAASGDHIFFALSIQGGTISVTAGLPNLSKDVTIDAAPNGITIDGGGTSALIFYADSSANVTLRHLTIQHAVGNSGPALYNANASVAVDSCTFANNTATSGGGAIFNNATLLVLNSTFVGNQSGSYGGALEVFGNAVVAYSTFTGNSATSAGGAMSVTGTVAVQSSIIAGNTAPALAGPDIRNFAGSTTSLGYNLIGNTAGSNWAGQPSDQTGVDPMFSAVMLANNGGPTKTVALQAASPARSGGDCSGNSSSTPVIPPVSFDQRGFVRSTPCTIGAFDMTSIFYGTFEAQ